MDASLQLSLRTWPGDDSADTAISSLIPRIQQQRGHFKDINEALLSDEVAAGNGDEDRMDLDVPEAEAEEEAKRAAAATAGDVDPLEALAKAKTEMLEVLGHAHNEALLALDFISLVASLNAPETAIPTMSPALKQAVPPGCLGFDRVSRKVDKKAQADDQRIAKEWKRQGLASAAEALMAASRKLGAEGEKERKYWEEVLAIRNDGWLITRMPRERNVLGVRYGFAEAAKEYKDKGIGALRRSDDGSVRMSDVDTGTKQRAMVRVRVMRNGNVVGTSTQRAGKNDGSVKDMIRRARNFIYEDELFFEVTKEARAYAGHGMRTSEDAVTIELGSGRMIVLDMAPLDDDSAPPNRDASNPENTLAQAIGIALRILLSYNHRLALKARSHPPPPLTARKPPRQPLLLLRPVATHLHHHQHLQHLTSVLARARRLAQTAGLSASYSVSPLSNTLPAAIDGVESAIEPFLHVLETTATVNLPSEWTLGITMRTRLQHPTYGTQYVVSTSHDGFAARLMGENKFASQREVEEYIHWCFERSVVNWIRLMSAGAWAQEAQGNEMVSKGKRVRIEVDRVGLKVTWGQTGGSDQKAVWDGTEQGRSLGELLAGIAG
ncbi:subunit 17 of mediator complex-domain-containing protein [Sphaerosporella brunnea]|uniref:Mediator of RNA polymerase II transcription subunit 17 n=1 Tax=Sphaerosporella brunnea TaxID=1250544 RepID=A0A5J5ETH5_9PEZI|nr:subunit 17 of mediator complex-domain-containing protein [Sphaerosporella brunnea]